MSGIGAWIWGTSQLDEAIDKATSELLPAGSEDIALNLEICDQIRSKSAPAKDAMKGLKRRLNHKNPNVQLLALSLTDICVKNAGDLFLTEIASREFMDNLVSILKIPTLNHDVKNTMLRFIQNWSIAFEAKPQLAYVGTVYKQLQGEGFKFPPKDLAIANSAMIDTQTAPEWIDSDVCLRCRTAFTFTNRKHHCRNCGQVFDQACSSKTMPLPHYGITQEVRVCDGCYSKITKKAERSASKKEPRSPISSKPKHSSKHRTSGQDMEDAELQRAIQLSLQESSSSRTGYVAPSDQWQRSEPPLVERNTYSRDTRQPEEEDPDLKAAIEASLREANAPRASAPLETPRHEEPNYAPSYPTAPRVPNHDLDPMESDTILTFNQTVEQAESQGGRDLSQYPAVTSLYDKANNLRPKMALSLEDSSRKQDVLSEMHTKLSEAVKLYDQILTQQVTQPRYRSSVASPSYQPASSAYHTAGYAPQQYVPQQTTGTYAAASPPPQQTQYAHPQYAPSAPPPSSQYAPSAPPFSPVVSPTAPPSLPPVTYGTHMHGVTSPPPSTQTSLPQSPPPMQQGYASAPPQQVMAPPPPPPQQQQQGAQLARSHTTASSTPQYHHQHAQHQQQQQQQRAYQQQQYQQEQARQNLIASAPAAPAALPYFPAAPTGVPQTQFEHQEERKEAMLIDL